MAVVLKFLCKSHFRINIERQNVFQKIYAFF